MADYEHPARKKDRHSLTEALEALEHIVATREEHSVIEPDPSLELLKELKDELNNRS